MFKNVQSSVRNTNDSLKLFALIVTGSVSSVSNFLIGLLLIEMAETFNVSIGLAGQLNTARFVLAIFFSLITSYLSVKYDHKLILQLGLLAFIISALGCYFATDFVLMMFFYSFNGIGYALGVTMIFTLTNLFPNSKKGQVIGFIMAGMAGSYLLGVLVVPPLVDIGGWRLSFLGYMFPLSLIALILTTISIPKRVIEKEIDNQSKTSDGFKSIFNNKSALASLTGYLLAMLMWASLSYIISYLRESFKISLSESSLVLLMGSLLYMIGSLISTRLSVHFGRKFFASITIGVAGILLMVIPFTSLAIIAIGLFSLICLFVSWMDTSSTSLILEQDSKYTGIMMSMQRVTSMLGSSIGSGLGGLIILSSGYFNMFIVLGIFGILSASMFYFFTIDPS